MKMPAMNPKNIIIIGSLAVAGYLTYQYILYKQEKGGLTDATGQGSSFFYWLSGGA